MSQTMIACRCCGNHHPREDMALLDCGVYYCSSCSHVNCHLCDQELTRGQDDIMRSELNGYEYCYDCYAEEFFICDNCGDESYSCDMVTLDDGCYCTDCARTVDKGNIHSYDYKPSPVFFSLPEEENTEDRFHIAFELETEYTGHESLGDVAGFLEEDFLYFKEDGSISHGFEIVSHPMTWAWVQKNRDKIDSLLSKAIDEGLRSYDTDTCGIHIHISKNSVGNFHLYKFLKFIYENKDYMLKISQRKKCNLERWAKLDDDDYDIVETAKNKNGNGDKYVAVNCNHPHSIEVRVFRGTLKKQSFYKNLEFMKALYSFTMDCRVKDVNVHQFHQYVKDHKCDYSNLFHFIDNNGGF